MQAFPTWEVLDNAEKLEPMDDVMKRLSAKYGPVNAIVDYLSKSKGSYKAVPAISGSQYKPACSRIDTFKAQMGMDLQAMFPVADQMGPGYDKWTWDDVSDRRREVQQGRHAVRAADGPVQRRGGLGRLAVRAALARNSSTRRATSPSSRTRQGTRWTT